MKSYAQVTRPANLLRNPCCRTDKQWRRRGNKYKRGGRPELSNAQTVAALGGVWKRKARQAAKGWTLLDHTTLHEVEARAMGFDQIQDCRGWMRPAWLTREVAPRKLMLLLTMLLHSYRAGAIGMLCSYEEWCGLLDCSRKTVNNYQREAEALGLIRILPTCKENERAGGKRNRARNLLQLGPALIKLVGCGLLEGAAGQKSSRQGDARSGKARKARKAARAVRRDQWGTSWQRHEEQRQRPQARAESPSRAQPQGPKVPSPDRRTRRPERANLGENPSAPLAEKAPEQPLSPRKVTPQPPGSPLKGEAMGREREPSVPGAAPGKEIRRAPNLPVATPPSSSRTRTPGAAASGAGGGACPERAARTVPEKPPEAEAWADVVALGEAFVAKLRGESRAELAKRRREEATMVRELLARDRERERIARGREGPVASCGASVNAEGFAGAVSPTKNGAPKGAP